MKKVILALVLVFTLLSMYSCVGYKNNHNACQAKKIGNHR